MASGGVRGNAGRRPEPGAARRELKSDKDGWIVLPQRYDGPVPEFPLSSPTDREMVLWERQWAKPQAAQWSRLFLADEVALYVRYLAEAEQPDASASVRTLVKQHQEMLALSTAGLLRNRWKIATDQVGAKRDEAEVAPARPSSRSKLKVVPGGS